MTDPIRTKRPRAEPPAIEKTYLSTADVSRALGVGVTTVKRWVDDGILAAQRTPGGHRKLLLDDLLRLIRAGELPHAELSTLQASAITDIAAIRKRLSNAVDTGDADAICDVILGAFRGGLGIGPIADSLIAPALRRIGDCWKRGTLTVMEEHRITRMFISAVHQLESKLQVIGRGARPLALGGAPEGDHSVLPTLLAKLTLLDAGWDAIDLGPHTPFSAFSEAIETQKPMLVWLSASHIGEIERFMKDYGKFHRAAGARGIVLAIGGSALTPELKKRMPCSLCGDGFVSLAEFANAIHPMPTVPSRGRPVGSTKK